MLPGKLQHLALAFAIAVMTLLVPNAQAQTPNAKHQTPLLKAQATRAYGKLPLAFEENRGQVADRSVKFLAHTPQGTLFLTDTEAVLALPMPQARRADQSLRHDRVHERTRPTAVKMTALRMRLAGANRSRQTAGQSRLPGIVNYFIGRNPKQWHTNIPTYRKATFAGIYPGVNMVYYGTQDGRLEYDFVVKPGADPKRIKLTFTGAQGARVTTDGDLALSTPVGEVIWHRPVTYQVVDGRRREVACSYQLERENGTASVQFMVARYDAARPLVIDPVLQYSTFLGGSGGDHATSIAVDVTGSAYVTGYTYSSDFPLSTGAFQSYNKSAWASGSNAFVTKLSANGSTLIYSTYLGGSGASSGANDGDQAFCIAVDNTGNAYVAGSTNSASFPVTVNAFQTKYKSNGANYATNNAFVTKLNVQGSSLVYSTFLGGTGNGLFDGDKAYGISIDKEGNAYVAGQTYSSDFPVTSGALQTKKLSPSGDTAAFVTKLNASGTGLLYSTYLSGTGNYGYGAGDYATAIVVDSAGDAYVTGNVISPDFPITSGAFQSTFNAYSTTFITKLNVSGTGIIYSTFLGGSSIDSSTGIAIDGQGNAYITGQARSSDFPVTTGAYKTTLSSGTFANAFVTKINTSGSGVIYSTYLGGSWDEQAMAIALDNGDNAYVTGVTGSKDFPVTSDAFQKTNGSYAKGTGSPFLTKLNFNATALIYSTLLGGTSSGDTANGIAVDRSGNAYMTGAAISPDFPVTSRAFQTVNKATPGASRSNAFMSKFIFAPLKTNFYQDGNEDLVFQNSTTGQIAFWDMNGTTVLAGELLNSVPDAGYQVVGTGDFNGDGLPDLIFQNQNSGQIAFWFMNGNYVIGGGALARIPSAGYKVVGVGDFNGDGLPDLLFQNTTTGQLAVWYMNGAAYLGGSGIADVPATGWQVVGVGDFNGDGSPDILFQNPTTGQLVVWYMNGSSHIGGAALSQSPYSGWLARAVADFNHDGSPDIAFQNQVTGEVVIWFMNKLNVVGGGPTNLGPAAGFLIAGPR